MGMRFLARRLGQMVFTFFVILTILFFIFRIMPGDPAAAILDPKMSSEAKDMVRKAFGLDKPIFIQYLVFIKNTLQGDFGRSFYYNKPVVEVVGRRIFPTILLFTLASVLTYAIGIRLGKALAWRRGSLFDTVANFAGLLFYTVFIPWFGFILLWIFSYRLNLLPLAGMLSPELWGYGDASMFQKFWDVVYHLILPVTTLTLVNLASAMLLMRNSMLEVLREDFVVTARAKGLQPQVIRDRHVARNAMLPVITSFALSLAASVSGGVLTEAVFSWPGLGLTLLEAVLNYDYPLLQTAFLFLAVLVLVFNLLADMTYAYLDPRIRY